MPRTRLSPLVGAMLSLAAASPAMAQSTNRVSIGTANWGGSQSNVQTTSLSVMRARTSGAQPYYPPIGWKFSNLKVRVER
jgi:hypothetical protein